jgi:ribosomal protein L18E
MPETVQHKSHPECSITQPHDPAICGLVTARRQRSAEMNAAIERQLAEEHERERRRKAE